MECCHNHNGFVVVYEKGECPACEIIHDNFKMRVQLLTGATLANWQISNLPKCIQKMWMEISNKKKIIKK